MGDYRVTVKVRNARLLRAIRNAGYESVPKFCKAAGVSYVQTNDLINMTASPFSVRGSVRPLVEKIMDFLCEPFDSLFSDAQREALTTNKTERDVSAEQMFALMHENNSDQDSDPLNLLCDDESNREVRGLLEILTPKQADILAEHTGLFEEQKTLDEIAKKHGVTRERVRQIEAKAHRLIRRHAIDNELWEYINR